MIRVFQIEDEGLELEELEEIINRELRSRGVESGAVISITSIMQPTDYRFTRVFYREED